MALLIACMLRGDDRESNVSALGLLATAVIGGWSLALYHRSCSQRQQLP